MDISVTRYQLNDYVLMIDLPQELRLQINRIKKRFALEYQAPQASGQPFLLLSSFSAVSALEQKIVNRMEGICKGVMPFKIELRDFGSFPSHSIYINVVSKLPVSNLVREIKKAQRLLKPDKDHKPYFIDEAHITICKKLKPWQYEKGWLEYSHLDFTGRFIANSMALLRKSEKGFDSIQSFQFLGIQEQVSQGNLF